MYPPCHNTLFAKILFMCLGSSIITLCSVRYLFLKENDNGQQKSETAIYFSRKSEPNHYSKAVFTSISDSKVGKKISRRALPEEEEEEWELDNMSMAELPMLLGSDGTRPKWYTPGCARFPGLFTVQFSNIYWQIQETAAEIYYFYSAYLDMRGNSSTHVNHPYDNAVIRVLGMSNVIDLNMTTSALKACQFWFSNKTTPVFGKVVGVRMTWYRKWGNKARYFPYLITCSVPKGLKMIPTSVSIVPTHCTNATNNLNIIHRERDFNNTSNQISPKEISVCVKALDLPTDKMFNRLIEWIETLKLLGTKKIFFYEYYVTKDIEDLLEYYKGTGYVEVRHITLPGQLPNQPQLRHHYIRKRMLDKRLTELIPYNDCLYRNMYDYKYIAVMDTDELLLPSENISWSTLIQTVIEEDIGLEKFQKRPVTTFCFRNYYFLDTMMNGNGNEVSTIPDKFHMLRHIYRSDNFTGMGYMKCFHSTAETAGVHNHFAFFCNGGNRCNRHYINVTRGQMNHYRSSCVKDVKNCQVYMNHTVKDTKLWRYKDKIIANSQVVMQSLSN